MGRCGRLSLRPGWRLVRRRRSRGRRLWIGISTQTDEAVRRQIGALTHVSTPPLNVDPQQLESHVQVACAHDPRGFVFQSTSSLNGVDEATQQRVAALQLINRRLQLIEPWLAGGKVISQVTSLDGAEIGVLLYVDRRDCLFRCRTSGRRRTRLEVVQGSWRRRRLCSPCRACRRPARYFIFRRRRCGRCRRSELPAGRDWRYRRRAMAMW